MQNKAAGIDRLFDEGGDLSEDLDFTRARRPNLKPRRVNVDLPAWMVAGLDREAARLGVSRQALINLWIAERLE